jgi:cytidine deaminase
MFQKLYKVAQDIAMQKLNTGQCTPEDTVCVISAASQRVFFGVNHFEMQNGMQVNVHAEVDAMQRMQASGEFIAEFILLINVMSLQAMLPCAQCAGFIISLAPQNANCQIVLPDRMMPLSQLGQMNGNAGFNQGMPAGGQMYGNMQNGAQPQNGMFGQASMSGFVNMPFSPQNPSVTSKYSSAYVRAKKSSGSKLKDRVNGLANAGKDIGNDEPEESEFIKKLFKKK